MGSLTLADRGERGVISGPRSDVEPGFGGVETAPHAPARGGPDNFRVVRVAERHEASEKAGRNQEAGLCGTPPAAPPPGQLRKLSGPPREVS